VFSSATIFGYQGSSKLASFSARFTLSTMNR